MKKIFPSLVLVASSMFGFAQQDAQFSQNMFNRLVINPGYAGSNNAICSNLLGRQQWVSFPGAPKTFLLSVDAPVKMLHGGVGLNVMQDQLGFDKTIIANLIYAYRMPLGPGELGLGLNGGMVNKSLNGAWVAIDGHETDAAIPKNGVSDLVFDMGFGIYYNISEELYFGISSTHLPASTITATDLNFDLSRHHYIMAGYNYPLPSNPMIELKPSVFVKTDAASTQIDVNCNVMYNKTFWGGVSYRVDDAIAAIVGFQHSSGIRIGYSYDLTTSSIKNYSSGSHEIMLGYCFKLPEKSNLQKYKNVRFL